MLIVKDVHEEEPSSTVEEMEPKTQQDQTSVNEERLKEPNDGAYRLLDLLIFSTSLLVFLHAVFVVCADEEAMRHDTGSRGSLIGKNIENMAKGN